MNINMEEPVFTREDFDKITTILTKYGPYKRGVPTEWQLHVGPQSIVKISLEGPFGEAEWNELLHQLDWHGKWFKGMPTEPALSPEEFAEEVTKRLRALTENKSP